MAEARLRGKLLPLLAVEGKDRAARSRALALARDWMADHSKVPDSMWSPVLMTAVRADAVEIVPALIVRLGDEQDRVARRAIYQALSSTRTPALHPMSCTGPGLAIRSPPDGPLLDVPEGSIVMPISSFVRDHAADLVRRFPGRPGRPGHGGLRSKDTVDEFARFLSIASPPLPK